MNGALLVATFPELGGVAKWVVGGVFVVMLGLVSYAAWHLWRTRK